MIRKKSILPFILVGLILPLGIFLIHFPLQISIIISIISITVLVLTTHTKLNLSILLFYSYIIIYPLSQIASRTLFLKLMGRTIYIGDLILLLLFFNFLLDLYKKTEKVKFHDLDKIIFLLFIVNIVFFIKGLINGNDRLFSDFRAISLFLFLYFPATILFKEISQIRKLFVFILCYSGAVGILGLLERYGFGESLFLPIATEISLGYDVGDPGQIFGTPMYRLGRAVGYNLVGFSLFFGCLFFIYQQFFFKRFLFKFIWLLIILLNIALLITTKIKGYIMLPLSLLETILIIKLFSPIKNTPIIKRLSGLFLLIILLIVTVWIAMPEDWQYYMKRFEGIYYEDPTETPSLESRIAYARGDFESFKKAFFLGNGLGYRSFVFIPYRQRYYMATGEVGIPFTLAMTGVVGFVLINALLLKLFWISFKILKNSNDILISIIAAAFCLSLINQILLGHIWSDGTCFNIIINTLALRVFSAEQSLEDKVC